MRPLRRFWQVGGQHVRDALAHLPSEARLARELEDRAGTSESDCVPGVCLRNPQHHDNGSAILVTDVA